MACFLKSINYIEVQNYPLGINELKKKFTNTFICASILYLEQDLPGLKEVRGGQGKAEGR